MHLCKWHRVFSCEAIREQGMLCKLCHLERGRKKKWGTAHHNHGCRSQRRQIWVQEIPAAPLHLIDSGHDTKKVRVTAHNKADKGNNRKLIHLPAWCHFQALVCSSVTAAVLAADGGWRETTFTHQNHKQITSKHSSGSVQQSWQARAFSLDDVSCWDSHL